MTGFFDQSRLNQDEAELVQLHWAINQIWLVMEETSDGHTKRALQAHRRKNMPSLQKCIQDRRDRREKALLETLYDDEGMPVGWEAKRAV